MTGVLACLLAVVAGIVLAVSLHRQPAVRERSGIVSLNPALTNLLFQLGAGDRVTGVSEFSSLPPGQHRPIVGDLVRVNGEVMDWLRPRVVVYQQKSVPNMKWYQDEGIDLIQIPLDTLDDLRAAIRRLVKVAGKGEAEAAIAKLDGELGEVKTKVRGRVAPKVLLVMGRLAIGRSTWLNELVESAGGENVVTDSGYPMLNDGQINGLMPQVIIDVADSPGDAQPDRVAQRLAAWKRFDAVPAIKANRVYVLADPSITIPDLNAGRTALELARRIHPEAFAAESPASKPVHEQHDVTTPKAAD